MPRSRNYSAEAAPQIGRLCVGADWACSNGDLEALRYVAQCLASYATEPIHRDLLRLAEACTSEPEVAVEQWMRIKVALHSSSDA